MGLEPAVVCAPGYENTAGDLAPVACSTNGAAYTVIETCTIITCAATYHVMWSIYNVKTAVMAIYISHSETDANKWSGVECTCQTRRRTSAAMVAVEIQTASTRVCSCYKSSTATQRQDFSKNKYI